MKIKQSTTCLYISYGSKKDVPNVYSFLLVADPLSFLLAHDGFG
jgi:hypothetical protein